MMIVTFKKKISLFKKSYKNAIKNQSLKNEKIIFKKHFF